MAYITVLISNSLTGQLFDTWSWLNSLMLHTLTDVCFLTNAQLTNASLCNSIFPLIHVSMVASRYFIKLNDTICDALDYIDTYCIAYQWIKQDQNFMGLVVISTRSWSSYALGSQNLKLICSYGIFETYFMLLHTR